MFPSLSHSRSGTIRKFPTSPTIIAPTLTRPSFTHTRPRLSLSLSVFSQRSMGERCETPLVTSEGGRRSLGSPQPWESVSNVGVFRGFCGKGGRGKGAFGGVKEEVEVEKGEVEIRLGRARSAGEEKAVKKLKWKVVWLRGKYKIAWKKIWKLEKEIEMLKDEVDTQRLNVQDVEVCVGSLEHNSHLRTNGPPLPQDLSVSLLNVVGGDGKVRVEREEMLDVLVDSVLKGLAGIEADGQKDLVLSLAGIWFRS